MVQMNLSGLIDEGSVGEMKVQSEEGSSHSPKALEEKRPKKIERSSEPLTPNTRNTTIFSRSVWDSMLDHAVATH